MSGCRDTEEHRVRHKHSPFDAGMVWSKKRVQHDKQVVHPLNPLFRMSCQREVLDRIYAHNDLWLDGIETWNAGLCGIYANRVTMRANRQVYGWSEVGNSDAHTLHAIGRGCTLFHGTTAEDARTAIQSGLSTPGGKLWHVNDYLKLARYHINKRRPSSRQSAA